MEPVDLGHARARLETLARRARDLLGGSAVFSVAGAVAAAAGHSQLAFSFAFGAALAGAFWYLARSERTHLLTRLVAQGDAALVSEAEDFARELAAPPMRLRLARGLECAAESGRRGVHEYTWVRPERVFDIREELLRLAAGSVTWLCRSHPRARRSAGACSARPPRRRSTTRRSRRGSSRGCSASSVTA